MKKAKINEHASKANHCQDKPYSGHILKTKQKIRGKIRKRKKWRAENWMWKQSRKYNSEII